MDRKDYLTLGLSLAAFLISLITLFQKISESRRTIRNQLTDAISKLNAVNAEANRFSIEKTAERHMPQVNSMFAFFNEQRRFLVRQAVFLEEQIPRHVSDVELGLIARAFDAVGDQGQADIYFRKCITASPNDYMKALNLRGYAHHLFSQNDFEIGRSTYQESLNAFREDSDRARHTSGETYLRWGRREIECGFQREGEILLSRAGVAFESVGNRQLKHHGLSVLEKTKEELGVDIGVEPA